MESKQEEKFVLKQAAEELKKEQAKQAEESKPEEKKKEEKPAAGKGKKKPVAEKAKEEKKREIVLERLYCIPIKRYNQNKSRGARFSSNARVVRNFASKHLKTEGKKIKIDNKVATFLSKGGRKNLFAKLKVKISKDKEGIVLVELA
ncbi:MAG: hypothetical protein V1717_01350 [Candidatus Micrarchaeota archaeon]